MKNWHILTIFLTILTVFSSEAFAQKIKVRRVKGNQAVVEFSGGALQQGQAYELVQDEFSEAGASSSGSSRRRYLVNVNFSMSAMKSDAAGTESETDMSLGARFGWNFGQFEMGPLFSYSSDSTGKVTVNVLKAGGWADFNLIPNIPGEIFVFGVGGFGAFGQSEGGGSSLTIMEFGGGPFIKWFPLATDVGFRADVGYGYQKQSGGTSGDVTITGLTSNAGLIAYF
ncbi:hypothetical protein [Bdellovibrio bacteriovorus]|uniref:hypothetical protein n=1 Tax=Bdellovibrio bacteriovorus TaxID=959 RepID=UPI000A80F1ED|nr:hypothetical protein [Bdellovibrio bacteriovorus]